MTTFPIILTNQLHKGGKMANNIKVQWSSYSWTLILFNNVSTESKIHIIHLTIAYATKSYTELRISNK